jgi:branched-chain amino acid transport system permease protein
VLIGAAIPAALAVVLSIIFTSNWEVALTTSILATLLMLSWIVITGYLGQISLVQVSLAGLAAFVAAKLAANLDKVSDFDLLSINGPNLPDPLAALLGILAAVGLGLIIGLPAVRIRGVQLAVVTAAAAGPIGLLLLKNEFLFGEAAVSNYPVPRPFWFGTYLGATDPDTARTDYWRFTIFAIVVTVIIALAVAGLRRGATGRRFLAVRANERAAAAAGINVARTKLLGFAIAAAIAGLAGVVQSYRLGSIQPENYGLFASLAAFAFVYLGGITSLYGSVVGGLLVAGGLVAQFIDERSDGGFEQYVPMIGAIGLILTAILNPEGIALANAELGKGLWRKIRGGRAASVAEPAPAVGPVAAGGGH